MYTINKEPSLDTELELPQFWQDCFFDPSIFGIIHAIYVHHADDLGLEYSRTVGCRSDTSSVHPEGWAINVI